MGRPAMSLDWLSSTRAYFFAFSGSAVRAASRAAKAGCSVFTSRMRLAFSPISGWATAKYRSISKLTPSPLVRHTGWVFSFREARTSSTSSPRVSLMKAKASWASWSASLASGTSSNPRSPSTAERNSLSLYCRRISTRSWSGWSVR